MTAPVTQKSWRDRHGTEHPEVPPSGHRDEPRMRRVVGPVEREWADAADREALAGELLATPNPRIAPAPQASGEALWTWVVDAADARAVLLWTDAVFDHADVERAEFRRLPGSSLWTICLRLPSALRCAYRIAVWRSDEVPPWRSAVGRRATILAALAASEADPRGRQLIAGSRGTPSSVAAGPDAPADVPRSEHPGGPDLHELVLPDDVRAWVYTPPVVDAPTPLLILFDGRVWRDLGLADLLDAAIAHGAIPPLHVAMIDSRDGAERWDVLGVPGMQVDTVLDHLLPAVRDGWQVDPRGEATICAGQSLGGLAALWTVALSEGEVRHAIAQSASLWRFSMAEPLSNAEWDSITLRSGTFEPDMLADARQLHESLLADESPAGRRVLLHPEVGGHDWAVWRVGLIHALAEVLQHPGS